MTMSDASSSPARPHAHHEIRPDDATRAVQLGAAILLGGGFYYGFTKQQSRAKQELQKAGNAAATSSSKLTQPARVRTPTFFERRLGLDRPQSAGGAAFRALLGGTIAALTGATVLVLAAGGILGVRNLDEFRIRMEELVPPMQVPESEKFDNEDAELEFLSAVFEEGMQEETIVEPTVHHGDQFKKQ